MNHPSRTDRIVLALLVVALLFFAAQPTLLQQSILDTNGVAIADGHQFRYLQTWMYTTASLELAVAAWTVGLYIQRVRTGDDLWLALAFLQPLVAVLFVLINLTLQVSTGVWQTMSQAVMVEDFSGLLALLALATWRFTAVSRLSEPMPSAA